MREDDEEEEEEVEADVDVEDGEEGDDGSGGEAVEGAGKDAACFVSSPIMSAVDNGDDDDEGDDVDEADFVVVAAPAMDVPKFLEEVDGGRANDVLEGADKESLAAWAR